jgi:hypothetical protein
MTIKGPRILYTQLDGTDIATDSEGNTTSGTGWQTLANNVSVARTFLDLAGYQREDLTLFLQGSQVQDGMPFLGDSTSGYCIDLITTEYVSDDEILTVLNAPLLNQRQFGYFASTIPQQNITYGRHRQFGQSGVAQLTIPIPVLVSTQSFGTCSSTAGTRLYITRLVFNAAPNTTLSVPQSNWVVTGILAKEPTLEYMMRLTRSSGSQAN